jgi:hypothetical protein
MLWILIAAAAACYLIISMLIFFLSGFLAKKFDKNPKKYRLASLGLLGIITAATFAWNWFVSPLPSDEYMIEHFNQHRAEYEELVAGYIKAKSQDNEAMKVWLDNPRKIELQRAVKAKDERVNPESSQWYGGIELNAGLGDRKEIVHSMEFHVTGATSNSIREHSIVWKSYWYFLEAQSLTKGKSLCPASSDKLCLGQMNIEVLPSLNHYPLFAEIGGDRERWCGSYMRQLDDHWFLASSKACL